MADENGTDAGIFPAWDAAGLGGGNRSSALYGNIPCAIMGILCPDCHDCGCGCRDMEEFPMDLAGISGGCFRAWSCQIMVGRILVLDGYIPSCAEGGACDRNPAGRAEHPAGGRRKLQTAVCP